MFEDMVVDAAVTYQQTGGETLVDGEVRYSLKEDAKTEVKKALSNKFYDKEIELTYNTPSIIAEQKGARDLPMFMVASHIRENILTEKEARKMGLKVNPDINYHGLGESLFYKVIDDLDEVVEAYRGTPKADNPSRREKYFILISQHKDKNGDVINIPVYINEHGRKNKVFIDVNKVATVFGKENLRDYLQREIRKGNLVRIKKRNTQTSESTSPINADYEKDVSNINISNPSRNVNHQKQKKQNYFATKTFSEAMADTISQETTGLYDRLTEALDKHSGIQRAVGADYALSSDFDGTYFKYTDSNKGNAEQIENAELSRAELDGYLGSALDFGQEIASEEKLNPAEMVSGEVAPKPSIFTKEGAKKTWNAWRRTWTDTGATVYDIAKAMNDQTLYHYYNAARSSTNAAIYMVMDKQVDICGNEIGKGLNEIFNPIRTKGLAYYNEFQLYLLHLHNVDRMSRRSQQAIEQAAEEFRIVVEAPKSV